MQSEYFVFKSGTVLTNWNRIPLAEEWFSKHMRKLNKSFAMHRSGRPEEEVKIAVLDTGLDIGHLLLRTYQDKGQIDVENYIDFTDPNNKKPTDDVGHGTCCTHLILKTCHAAKIYVAKVFRKATPDNDTADCIAKVRYGVQGPITNN